jgi:hypothetical protein
VLNLLARMLMGSHLTTSLIESLPAPAWGDSMHRLARLAARASRRPASPPIAAALQAEAAALFGLDSADFSSVLEAVPLVPATDRRLAMRIFARRRT